MKHRKDPQGWQPRRGKSVSRWAMKSIPLSELLGDGEPRGRGAHDATGGVHETGLGKPATGMVDELRLLDSVVHDFIASLDQMNRHVPTEGPGSEHIARFVRILESPPPSGGSLLGPPVLCGMSPPIGLESVLAFIGTLRKTGILRVHADGTVFMISVVRGDVVHGVSHPRPESELLGNLLVRRGAIDVYRLRSFFDQCGSSPRRIGEALNRQELSGTDDLREALEIQLQLLFDRLLAARSSEWCFHEGEAMLSYVTLRMSTTTVLLESARKRDEGSAP